MSPATAANDGARTAPWWTTAVFYQVYPRSFCDTDGDGVGDLPGIRRHLDHLVRLGVDALWISPFFPSPMADFGYDVADYCDVDPLFGTLDDFDALLADCHQRGIRVLVDWVPNHSSDRHPWFVEARSSRDSARRDWYVWRDGTPDAPPNNWIGAFSGGEGAAWTWDEPTRQWYLHCYLPEQPDLNWENPDVVAAMHDTLRFWLDRGVDGFRMDAVHNLGKDPTLPDHPGGSTAPRPVDDAHTMAHLRGARRVLDEYDDRVAVGEVYLLDTARVSAHVGPDLLHLAFNFPPLRAPWDATVWRGEIAAVERLFPSERAWPTWVLSNHDHPRHRTRYGSDARARAAAALLLTLRGSPFLYAGEELGLEDAEVPDERVVDPGGRDGCRAPVPWTADAAHGWASSEPWLPWPPDAAARSAQRQWEDPDSMLALYARLLRARRASPALHAGELELLDAPAGVVAYRRHRGDDQRVVVVNFTAATIDVGGLPAEGWRVEVATDRTLEGAPFTSELGPDAALVLRPA